MAMIENRAMNQKQMQKKNGSLNSDADFLPRALATPRRTKEQINRNGENPFRARQISQEPSTPPDLCFFKDPSSFTRAFALSSRLFNPFRRRFWAARILSRVKLWVRAGKFWAFPFFALFAFVAGRSCFCAISSAASTAGLETGPVRGAGESRTLLFIFRPPGLGVEGAGTLVGL